jgi:phage-related protein
MYKIILYKDKNDKEPLKAYFEKLREDAAKGKDGRIRRNKVIEYLNLLKEHGTRAGVAITKHINNDIWELRPLADRIFYAYWKDNTFVLLHQFQKKTQKTPKKEIDQAMRNLKEWLERDGI